MSDGGFTVCHDGQRCRRETEGGKPQPGSESAGIVQRLDDLMRRVREDGHRLTYVDLVQVRHGGA